MSTKKRAASEALEPQAKEIEEVTAASQGSKSRISSSSLPAKPTSSISQTLYIKNLNDKVHHDLIKHSLYLLFSSYGDVIDIVIKPHDRKMRGQAHIILNSNHNATVALKNLQNLEFFGKPLNIAYSNHKSKVIQRAEANENYELDDQDTPSYV